MAITSITPYITFNGNAADAISFYSEALSARAAQVLHYSDAPAEARAAGGPDLSGQTI